MKISERAHKALKQLEELWKDPDRLTGMLEAVLITSPTGRPIDRWSLRNRLLCALSGTADARTFNQWRESGRSVIKGHKAIYILAPIVIKDEEERTHVVGYRGVPVFCLEDTDGEPVPVMNTPPPPPLAEVAKRWNISVKYAPSTNTGTLGWYNKTQQSITLLVENPSVYFHELMHAADDKTRTDFHGGQDPDQEAVAEIGSAVLARLYDQPTDKRAFKYVGLYHDNPLKAMQRLLPRIEKCLTAILSPATLKEQTQ